MNHKFELAWEREVTQIVYASVIASSKEEALKIVKGGKSGFEIIDTIDIEILSEKHPHKVKCVKKGVSQ